MTKVKFKQKPVEQQTTEQTTQQPVAFKHKTGEPLFAKCDNLNLKSSPEFFSQVTTIFGTRGSGKSFAAGVKLENANMQDVPFIVFDPQKANINLTQMNTAEHPVRLINDQQDPQRLARDLKIKPRQSVVIIPTGNIENYMIWTNKFLQEYMIAPPIGIRCIVFDEFHLFAPNVTKRKRTVATDAIMRLITTMRSTGIGVIMITQRVSEADTTAINQSDNYVIFGLKGVNDLERAGNILGFEIEDKIEVKNTLREIRNFEVGECLIISNSLN